MSILPLPSGLHSRTGWVRVYPNIANYNENKDTGNNSNVNTRQKPSVGATVGARGRTGLGAIIMALPLDPFGEDVPKFAPTYEVCIFCYEGLQLDLNVDNLPGYISAERWWLGGTPVCRLCRA